MENIDDNECGYARRDEPFNEDDEAHILLWLEANPHWGTGIRPREGTPIYDLAATLQKPPIAIRKFIEGKKWRGFKGLHLDDTSVYCAPRAGKGVWRFPGHGKGKGKGRLINLCTGEEARAISGGKSLSLLAEQAPQVPRKIRTCQYNDDEVNAIRTWFAEHPHYRNTHSRNKPSPEFEEFAASLQRSARGVWQAYDKMQKMQSESDASSCEDQDESTTSEDEVSLKFQVGDTVTMDIVSSGSFQTVEAWIVAVDAGQRCPYKISLIGGSGAPAFRRERDLTLVSTRDADTNRCRGFLKALRRAQKRGGSDESDDGSSQSGSEMDVDDASGSEMDADDASGSEMDAPEMPLLQSAAADNAPAQSAAVDIAPVNNGNGTIRAEFQYDVDLDKYRYDQNDDMDGIYSPNAPDENTRRAGVCYTGGRIAQIDRDIERLRSLYPKQSVEREKSVEPTKSVEREKSVGPTKSVSKIDDGDDGDDGDDDDSEDSEDSEDQDARDPEQDKRKAEELRKAMRAELIRKYDYFASEYNRQQKAFMEEHGITQALMDQYPQAVSVLVNLDGVDELELIKAFIASLRK